MPEKMKRVIAHLFYQENRTKKELMTMFSIREKTLDKILAEYRPQ